MLSSKVTSALLQRVNKSALTRQSSTVKHFEKRAIGNREIVGYGCDSMPKYVDKLDLPFPAIRYKEIKGDLIGLVEKQKGDWKKLTIDEKKTLYRANFCRTYAELLAPTGQWKSVLGIVLMGVSASLILFMLMRIYYPRQLPLSFDQERREAQLRRKLILRVNPITGVSSKWDYEKDDWKK